MANIIVNITINILLWTFRPSIGAIVNVKKC